MSQSATLYRISFDTFAQLKSSKEASFDRSSAKNQITFQGSFMGLEYLLSKGSDISAIDLLKEIFNPSRSLGEQEFGNLTPDEKFEFYKNGNIISYLDSTTISNLNIFLDKVSENAIQSRYDKTELNDKGIYPEVWHNDNSPDQAYNQRHILEDFKELKEIISQADKHGDYILVFVG
ncbi:MAG: DUF1877 family protein [Bacteroidota bacterium]